MTISLYQQREKIAMQGAEDVRAPAGAHDQSVPRSGSHCGHRVEHLRVVHRCLALCARDHLQASIEDRKQTASQGGKIRQRHNRQRLAAHRLMEVGACSQVRRARHGFAHRPPS
jgi:hypothetical protein